MTAVCVDLCSGVAKDGVVCISVLGDFMVGEISSVGVAVNMVSKVPLFCVDVFCV